MSRPGVLGCKIFPSSSSSDALVQEIAKCITTTIHVVHRHSLRAIVSLQSSNINHAYFHLQSPSSLFHHPTTQSFTREKKQGRLRGSATALRKCTQCDVSLYEQLRSAPSEISSLLYLLVQNLQHQTLSIITVIPKLVTLCIPIILSSIAVPNLHIALSDEADRIPLLTFSLKPERLLSYSSLLLYNFIFTLHKVDSLHPSSQSFSQSIRAHCVIYTFYFFCLFSFSESRQCYIDITLPPYNSIHCRPHRRPTHK